MEIKLKGIDEVINNLNKELKSLENKTFEGLIRCAILIRRETEQNPPVTPVDTGNLRASWFATTARTQQGKGAQFKGENAQGMQEAHKSTIADSTTVAKNQGKPFLVMGYSASYAVYVHEMVNADFTSPRRRGKSKKMVDRRKGAGAKWFETALFRNTKQILEILRNSTKID